MGLHQLLITLIILIKICCAALRALPAFKYLKIREDNFS